MKLKSLNLEIIDICNLKCSMCDIWKNKNQNILTVNTINEILQTQYIDKNTDITITGGEPLLYPNFFEIIDIFKQNKKNIKTISTNGTLGIRLHKILQHMLNIGEKLPNIHISIDGYGYTHDNQRGIAGSFQKSLHTIISTKKKFPGIHIKIKYTITSNNIKDIIKIFKLSQKLGVDITFKIIENDINYTNRLGKTTLLSTQERNTIYTIIEKIYKHKNQYINNLLYYIKHGRINFQCKTPKKNIFIMANGDVFACTHYNKIGNIVNEKVETIIYNDIHKNLIDLISKNNCQKCFSPHGSHKTNI